MDNNSDYYTGAVITGFIVFIGVWIYAIASWGFLIGVTIGWLPAIISATILGLLWPLVALVVVVALGLIVLISLR